ncbi:MAG: glutamyl-tRNA synthetase [Patescibacteria group bacterium]|jgi:glutamyl-tRNA synthetase
MVEISKETIRTYALENASKYEGVSNPSSVLSSLFAEGLEKSEIKNIMPLIQEVTKEVNSLSISEQEKEFESLKDNVKKREIRVGLPELPNIKGKVVMRFAPFPSGPIHIGNTRQLILNDEYVKRYGGKMILVMDDTIGSEQKPLLKEAYDLIPEAVEWLECKTDKKIIYKSDRIETYYKYAEELIGMGHMYLCSCKAETLRENKENKKECSCRNLELKEQQQRWKDIFTAPEGSMVVRLKTSMSDPDPAFRDRIMLRIADREHIKLGTKYRVFPLLDFSWAIDDHLLGMTHIIRGMDLQMETKVEKFIWDIYGWEHPEVIHTGFFEIEGVKISKSKGAKEVLAGEYIGWNDPRLWSIQSLQDRGIKPEAIREFITSQGIKKSNTKVPVDILYSINRKLIGDVPKFTLTEGEGNITIVMNDGSKKTGALEEDLKSLKENTIIYISKLGYANIQEIKDNKLTLFFTHK